MEIEDKNASSFTNNYTVTNAQQNTKMEPVFVEIGCADNSSKVKQAGVSVKQERTTSPDHSSATEEGKVRLQCAECSRVYFSAEDMACHMRRHRGQNPFQCVMCEYNTYNKTLFMEHVNSHLGIKPYQCGKCNYKSVSKKYMKIHEAKHATCEQCGHVARNRAKLAQHLLETGHQDSKCSLDEVSRPRRRRKRRAKDLPDPESEGSSSDSDGSIAPVRSEKGKYNCVPCKEKFTSRSAMRVHLNTHNPCPKCNVKLPPKLLSKHIKKEHGKSVNVKKLNGKKFKCNSCDFKANGLARILLHLIHHPQEVDSSIDLTPLVNCGFIANER